MMDRDGSRDAHPEDEACEKEVDSSWLITQLGAKMLIGQIQGRTLPCLLGPGHLGPHIQYVGQHQYITIITFHIPIITGTMPITISSFNESISFSSDISTVSFILMCNSTCNMNDRGMEKTVLLLWRSHNNDQVVHAPIIHVAGAFTDTDETYGAYVAAENNTFNNTNNSNSNSNNNGNSNNNFAFGSFYKYFC